MAICGICGGSGIIFFREQATNDTPAVWKKVSCPACLSDNKFDRLIVARLYSDAIIPTRAYDIDAGYDLYAHSIENDDGGYSIGTGIAIDIPPGISALIRGRSGFTANGAIVPDGTVDPGYTGEIRVFMFGRNEAGSKFMQEKVVKGARIAQMVLVRVETPDIFEVSPDGLSKSERGTKAFGSSGQ